MRFAFVISSGLGYRIPSLFESRQSFKEFGRALQVLRANGFEGVELNLHFDDQRRLSVIERLIDNSGLKLVSIGTGLVYVREKLSLTDPDKNERAKALAIVRRLINFAAKKNARVVVGVIRGTSQPDTKTTTVHLRDCLKECDTAARQAGTQIAVEAVNRYETGFLNTADDVVSFIKSGRLTSTGLLLDTFHMNIEEHSIEETIRKHVSKLVHFHIADSNRWPPGYGHLKVEDSLRLLQDLGYRDWVSAEPLPKPSGAEAVKATARFLQSSNFMEK